MVGHDDFGARPALALRGFPDFLDLRAWGRVSATHRAAARVAGIWIDRIEEYEYKHGVCLGSARSEGGLSEGWHEQGSGASDEDAL